MNIKDFMIENTDETEEIIIKRFPTPFKIKAITQEKNEEIRNRCLIPVKKNGVVVSHDVDTRKFARELMVECVVVPDFRNSELCKFYATLDPLEVPGRMLKAGEYNKLSSAVSRLNGFSDEANEEITNEVKN